MRHRKLVSIASHSASGLGVGSGRPHEGSEKEIRCLFASGRVKPAQNVFIIGLDRGPSIVIPPTRIACCVWRHVFFFFVCFGARAKLRVAEPV